MNSSETTPAKKRRRDDKAGLDGGKREQVFMMASPAAPSAFQPLPGSVCAQYIRCGKSSCHCKDGEPHGPYHYRIWREGDHVRKVYIPAEEVEAVRLACRAYKDITNYLRDMRRERLRLSQSIKMECKKLLCLQNSLRISPKR